MRRSSSVPVDSSADVLLQAFNWEVCEYGSGWFKALAAKAANLHASGFAAVWLPPASVSVSKEGYLPRELEVLHSKYGTEADLRSCISAFKAAGVVAIADVVVNHRCAGKQDSEGRWNVFTGRYDWDASCVCSNDPQYGGTGAAKTTAEFNCAPNIDHSNPRVRQDIKHWLHWLKYDVGFRGLRFDFAKGYGANWVKEYVEATRPHLAIGEVWTDCKWNGTLLDYDQNAHRQETVDWIDGTNSAAAAFDFTTKAILQEAIKRQEYWRLRDADGKPPGVMGWWPERSVTFLENHDTGSTQMHWPFPEKGLHQGYAYILLHPGIPCVFYDHVYSDGLLRPSLWRRLKSLVAKTPRLDGTAFTFLPLDRCIVALIALRKKHGITSHSRVQIVEASKSVYAAVVNNQILVKIGPAQWDPPSLDQEQYTGGWKQELVGPGFTVWALKQS